MTAPSRLVQFKMGPRAVSPVPWPGRPDVLIGIRPLTGGELQRARIQALQALVGVPPVVGSDEVRQDIYGEELAYQLLAVALVDVESGQPFAASPTEIREHLTVEEVGGLMVAYQSHQQQTSPNLDTLAGPEIDAVVADLGKAGAPGTPSPGDSGPMPTRSSGFRVQTAPMGSSSTSSPDSSKSGPLPLPKLPPPALPLRGEPLRNHYDPESSTPTDRR